MCCCNIRWQASAVARSDHTYRPPQYIIDKCNLKRTASLALSAREGALPRKELTSDSNSNTATLNQGNQSDSLRGSAIDCFLSALPPSASILVNSERLRLLDDAARQHLSPCFHISISHLAFICASHLLLQSMYYQLQCRSAAPGYTPRFMLTAIKAVTYSSQEELERWA